MIRPRVSVVVAVYNAERTLEPCIRSLLGQEIPEAYEIVCVDNGSTDATARILASFDDRIRVMRENKRGPAAARNRGIRAARGDIIALTDADCVASASWLRSIVAPLDDASVGIVGGKILAATPSNAIERFGEDIHDHERTIGDYRPPYVITMNWAARHSLVETLAHFDEALLRCSDVDFSYRAVRSGARLVYAPEAVVVHRNERTLTGLFNEGFTHGLYSVQAIKKHREFLAGYGYRSVSLKSYRVIASSFIDYLGGREREHSLCVAVFNSGKKLGKLVGSVRFKHFDA